MGGFVMWHRGASLVPANGATSFESRETNSMAHYYRPSAPQRSASSAALFQPVAGVPSHDGWSGSLLKRGAGNAAFKLRFFVLPRDTNRLLWYEDERGWQSSPPHRAVQIVGVGDAISASGEHRFCFDVWAKELDAGNKARGGVLTRMLRRKGSTTDGSLYRLAAGSYAEAVGMAARAEELLTSARSG